MHNQPAYCVHVEVKADGKPWFYNIKEYLSKGEYPEYANHIQKCTLQRLSNHFFHSGGNLYRRTPDLGLLRYVDATEASKLLEGVHAGTCGPHTNGFVLAKKILRAVHADMITVPPNELNATRSPWLFVAWGMDVIGPIEPTASNGHRLKVSRQTDRAITSEFVK
ncbi:uncharacterized protein [Nicotiana sylvestris]|uniref:uncharacterized protein n=1 Tax=Nicotiana sylvestris TaxID=4096 RepID=UPI00388CEB0E